MFIICNSEREIGRYMIVSEEVFLTVLRFYIVRKIYIYTVYINNYEKIHI